MIYRNLRIKTISVPEVDADGVETGKSVILEVIGMGKIKKAVPLPDGGVVEDERLYLACFHKEIGFPRKLIIIDLEDKVVEILKYEHENYEFRSSRKRVGYTGEAGRSDNHPRYSSSYQQDKGGYSSAHRSRDE